MLLYILPFVLLLVVAVVLKKRESNKDEQPKKAVKKTASKKPVKKTVKTEDTPAQDLTAKQEIKPELRQQIEGLIQQQNYSSAEALINKALNENNRQHELYLILLDIHQHQNDEFAVKQLMNHIRALQLRDLLVQAEEKIKEKERQAPADNIQYTPVQLEPEQPTQAQKAAEAKVASTNADFDSLLADDKKPEPKETLEFLEKKSEPTPDFSFEPKKEQPEPTLEFSVEPKKEQPEPTLEFSVESKQEHALDVSAEPQEFKFNLDESKSDQDVLIKEFPVLQEYDEATVNLDLAEQYIKLGAYESAKILLTQTTFNPQQETLAKNLLNKIAS